MKFKIAALCAGVGALVIMGAVTLEPWLSPRPPWLGVRRLHRHNTADHACGGLGRSSGEGHHVRGWRLAGHGHR